MKNLFLYYIKKRWIVLLIATFLTLLVSIVVMANSDIFRTYYNGSVSLNNTGIIYLSVVVAVFASLIPIYEFTFKMRKNSIDLFYSLPVKRYKLFLTKYLIGLLELFIIFTVSFIYVLIFVIISYNKNKEILITYGIQFNIIYYLPYYFSILAIGALLFTWVSFFYTRGNTVFDGLLLTALSVFVLMIAVWAFEYTLSIFKYHFGDEKYRYNSTFIYYTAYSPIVYITQVYERLVKGYNGASYWTSFIVMSCISIALIPLFLILNNNKKAEDTSDIVSEWYLYKLFIPVYIIGLYTIMPLNAFYLVIIPIVGYVAYVINNRHFKIKVSDLITLAASSGVGIILCVVLNNLLSR